MGGAPASCKSKSVCWIGRWLRSAHRALLSTPCEKKMFEQKISASSLRAFYSTTTNQSYLLHQLLQGWRIIKMVACKYHTPPAPINPESNTRNGMQRVCKMERRTLKPKWLPNNCRLVTMTVSQQRWTQRTQRCIFSDEGFVYGGCGNYHDRGSRKHLLERPRIVIGMTMRQNDAHNSSRSDSLSF